MDTVEVTVHPKAGGQVNPTAGDRFALLIAMLAQASIRFNEAQNADGSVTFTLSEASE